MNSSEVLFWLQIISALGSFLSGVGVVFAVIGLFYFVRQTRAAERATTATVYQSIVALGGTVNEMFITAPDLYSQIFGATADFTAPTVAEEQAANPRRFFSALKWLDYFETIFVLWSAIPVNLHEPWRAYIRSYIQDSLYIRRIVIETGWYGDELVQLCRVAEQPKSLTKR